MTRLHKWTTSAGLLAACLPGAAWAQNNPGVNRYEWGPHMMGWGGGWLGMIFGPIFMILILALTIAAAVLLVRWLSGPWHPTATHQPPSGSPPLDILKERFARGEIDQQEFEERRRVLGE